MENFSDTTLVTLHALTNPTHWLSRALLGPVSWCFSRAVKYPQYLDPIQPRPYSIRQDVAGIGYNEFSRAVDPTWVAKSGVFCEKVHGMVYSFHDEPCGLWVVSGNVVGLLIEVLNSCRQPSNLHLHPILKRLS